MIQDDRSPLFILAALGAFGLVNYYRGLNSLQAAILIAGGVGVLAILGLIILEFFSKQARERKKKIERALEIPKCLITKNDKGVYLGRDLDLELAVYLPDLIRARHVHILGATGSGKTESVILNFLKQDVSRNLGAIILDAKGDASFLRELEKWVPKKRLKVFDLSSAKSFSYDPLASGTPLEAAQRLFSSLQWSEEYYKSKAFSALQRLFEAHFAIKKKNPTIAELSEYLETPDNYSAILDCDPDDSKLAAKDFGELSGLRDQLRVLSIGYLKQTLSPQKKSRIILEDARKGTVIYFRLQSLLSSQLVTTVGKLVINHLNYLAGTAHRNLEGTNKAFIPTYLDEFASFACPEFADLISKARSAGLALHFSHQSIGDLAEISPGFLGRITDNSATKIVLRINDPDSAELMSRAFGTALYKKTTQRITNAKDINSAEVLEEGTQREAHRFRAAPDLLKTLPTGTGSVLIAHGEDTPHGASTVFRVQFPRLSP